MAGAACRGRLITTTDDPGIPAMTAASCMAAAASQLPLRGLRWRGCLPELFLKAGDAVAGGGELVGLREGAWRCRRGRGRLRW